MTWTYTATMTLPRDQVRFLVGDTNPGRPQLQDEEIAYLVTLASGAYRQAAAAAEAIAGKVAIKVNTSVGAEHLAFEQQYEHYMGLAAQLRRQAARGDALPFSGGRTLSDKERIAEDTDRVPPLFTRKMHRGTVGGTADTESLDR